MKAPPHFQETVCLIGSTITTWIEEPVVRRANREQRERDHRQDEHRCPQPQRAATLRTAKNPEEAGRERERDLHDRRTFVARHHSATAASTPHDNRAGCSTTVM
jgi:hypothetical protein